MHFLDLPNDIIKYIWTMLNLTDKICVSILSAYHITFFKLDLQKYIQISHQEYQDNFYGKSYLICQNEYIIYRLCHDSYIKFIPHDIHLNKSIIYRIYAFYGLVELLEKAYIVDKITIDNELINLTQNNICIMATKNNQLAVLELIHKYGGYIHSNVLYIAAYKGFLEILKWAKNYYYLYNDIWIYAAKGGHLEILKWGAENNYEKSAYDCMCAAAYGGHLHVLKWLLQFYKYYGFAICQFAAQSGQLQVLIWAKENGYYDGKTVCAYAANGGHFHILKWARENGDEWNYLTTCYAKIKNHSEIFDWAIENGCEYRKDTKIIYVYPFWTCDICC